MRVWKRSFHLWFVNSVNMKPTLWVFWLWQFMEFFTPHLTEYFDIYIFDRNAKNTQQIADLWVTPSSLEIAAGCDYIMLWYPAAYIGDLIRDITPFLQRESVVFDICSIKSSPAQDMLRLLPSSNHIIATHPIFWPQSGKHGITWLTMTISNVRCDADIFSSFTEIFSEKLWLKVVDISPEEHDREMAYIQGITHFIGRALKEIDIPNSLLATSSYSHLREAKEMVGNDSDALFLSIQWDNPFTQQVREKLMSEFERLQAWIQSEK